MWFTRFHPLAINWPSHSNDRAISLLWLLVGKLSVDLEIFQRKVWLHSFASYFSSPNMRCHQILSNYSYFKWLAILDSRHLKSLMLSWPLREGQPYLYYRQLALRSPMIGIEKVTDFRRYSIWWQDVLDLLS